VPDALFENLYLALPIWYINIHVPHPTLVTLEGGHLGNFGLPHLFCDGKKFDILKMWSHRMVKNHFLFCDG
jgi:hypothetical protein